MTVVRLLVVCCFVCLAGLCKGQEESCESRMLKDTMTVPDPKPLVISGQYIETTLKDFSTVRLFRTDDDKYYLKFVVKKNFYFDKTAVLEIRSGTKSYYIKNTTQYKINKTTGLFIVPIFKNYIATLKDEGMTSLYFSEAETDFTRRDTKQIREMAKCFYDLYYTKN